MSNQAEHDRRVDYVEFPSSDLAQTKAFYSGVFGWKFTDYGPEYVAFEDGRLNGGFHARPGAGTGAALVMVWFMLIRFIAPILVIAVLAQKVGILDADEILYMMSH